MLQFIRDVGAIPSAIIIVIALAGFVGAFWWGMAGWVVAVVIVAGLRRRYRQRG
jgi:hypothetical protein